MIFSENRRPLFGIMLWPNFLFLDEFHGWMAAAGTGSGIGAEMAKARSCDRPAFMPSC
jgi:hypothetical protein